MGSLKEFKDLPEEEQRRLWDIYPHIDELVKFANKAIPPTFKEVFGEKVGEHLWETYINHGRDFIALYNGMDQINKTKMFVYIYHKE